MNSIFQTILERILIFVSSVAISLGILTAPAISPSNQQPATLVGITENKESVATQEGKPVVTIATPTLTPATTPQVSLCETEIKAILPEVESEYLKLETIKKARLEVEWCAYTESDPQKKREDCQKWNVELVERENRKVADKMNEYKFDLTGCSGQEVKFSKYSSKIPGEY